MKRMIDGTWSVIPDKYITSKLLKLFFFNKCAGSTISTLYRRDASHTDGAWAVSLYLSIFFGFLLLPFDWTTSLTGFTTWHGFVRVRFVPLVDVLHLSQLTRLFISKPKFSPVQNKERFLCELGCSSNKPDYLRLVNYLFEVTLDQHYASPKHMCPQAWPRRPHCPAVFLL